MLTRAYTHAPIHNNKSPAYLDLVDAQCPPNGVIPMPVTSPLTHNERADATLFDMDVHLQLEQPDFINVLRDGGTTIRKLEAGEKREGEDLAYTAPFRVLSQKGVDAMRAVVHANDDYAVIGGRQPKTIRGLGYLSRFVRDYNYCTPMLNHLGALANMPNAGAVSPDPHCMNMSQTNVGKVLGKEGAKSKQMVDVWHMDSVDYVLVVLLSEKPTMGGKLLVAHMEAKEAMTSVQTMELPEHVVHETEYPGPGYGIFMQGSKIAHAVTGVLEANEPRLSCINSYASIDSRREPVPTTYETFNLVDPKPIVDAEFVRSLAWKTSGRLESLISNPNYSEDDSASTIDNLDDCIRLLTRARDAVAAGGTGDTLPWKQN